MPRKEAYFRVKEFESLLTRRLDQCNSMKIAEKDKNISRLFGRFIYWTGVNTSFLSLAGLLPTENSFCPQNWVISRYDNGYGLFRVDHTSTKVVSEREALQGRIKEEDELPHIINNFSVFPSRVKIAANQKAFLGKNTKRKFSEILTTKKEIPADETSIIQSHKTVFMMGVASGLAAVLKGKRIEPIHEEMFYDVLK